MPITFHREDRKSTRLNSSHVKISYAVFCLKKTPSAPRVVLRDCAPRATYTLSLHDALPIYQLGRCGHQVAVRSRHLARRQIEVVLEADADVAAERERRHRERPLFAADADHLPPRRSEEHTSELQSRENLVCRLLLEKNTVSAACCFTGLRAARDLHSFPTRRSSDLPARPLRPPGRRSIPPSRPTADRSCPRGRRGRRRRARAPPSRAATVRG